jgi:toxin YoeB
VKLVWAPDAWDDYLYWQDADPDTARRINDLIKEARRTPFQGTGRPEALKYDLKGWWSRRINHTDRLVYRVQGKGVDQTLEIRQCRLHY